MKCVTSAVQGDVVFLDDNACGSAGGDVACQSEDVKSGVPLDWGTCWLYEAASRDDYCLGHGYGCFDWFEHE